MPARRRLASLPWLLLLACAGSRCGSPSVPPSPIRPDYAGTWTGGYVITECVNVDDSDPDVRNHLGLCTSIQRMPAYRFDWTQTDTVVTGTYTLTTPLFQCPCGGNYGTFNMSGQIAPDGTLTISAIGSPAATGLTATMTFKLNIAGSSRLGGTVSGRLTFNGVEHATFSGSLVS